MYILFTLGVIFLYRDVKLDPQDETYDKPYTRIGSYLIGMFVGYAFSRNLEIKSKYKQVKQDQCV